MRQVDALAPVVAHSRAIPGAVGLWLIQIAAEEPSAEKATLKTSLGEGSLLLYT